MPRAYTKMDITYLIGELPQYHWKVSGNQLRTQWRGIRVSKVGDHYILTQKNDLNAYRYRSLGEVIEQLKKMSDADQMQLRIN